MKISDGRMLFAVVLSLAALLLVPIPVNAPNSNEGPAVLSSWIELPSGARRPEWCPSDRTYPIIWRRQPGTIEISCTIYSPDEIARRHEMHTRAEEALAATDLIPHRIMSVEYDPRADIYIVGVVQTLTPGEERRLQILLPAPFTVSIERAMRFSHVCNRFDAPPTGVCDEVSNDPFNGYRKPGTMGFRARRLVDGVYQYGGVTFSHGEIQVGDQVYQPKVDINLRVYGYIKVAKCTGDVDASFFQKAPGEQDMLNELLHVGPIVGDFSGNFVDGLTVVVIGRASLNVGYYTLTTNYNQNGCGVGTSLRANYFTGARSGVGDSGTVVSVPKDQCDPNGCRTVAERAGILWGGLSDGSVIYFTSWGWVKLQLGIESY